MPLSRLTATLPLAPAWLFIYMPQCVYTHLRILHRNIMHHIGALFKRGGLVICICAYIRIHAYCTATSCTILVHCLNGGYVAPHQCCTAPMLHRTNVAFHNVKSHLTMRNGGLFLFVDTPFLDPHPPRPGGPTERKFVYFCNFLKKKLDKSDNFERSWTIFYLAKS